MSSSAPFDPRSGRFRVLSRGMSVAMAATALAALVGVLAPDPLGRTAGVAMVTMLIVTPMVRVGWFVLRWFRRGDRRYAAVGLGVIAVSVTGALLALM